ncbi:hypothetical protein AFLA_008975 [Aspergillus flavus NRRL3357]|nr:hypothetical protein AFLA_008975 [Aspergillus flavus NRRL3357]
MIGQGMIVPPRDGRCLGAGCGLVYQAPLSSLTLTCVVWFEGKHNNDQGHEHEGNRAIEPRPPWYIEISPFTLLLRLQYPKP